MSIAKIALKNLDKKAIYNIYLKVRIQENIREGPSLRGPKSKIDVNTT